MHKLSLCVRLVSRYWHSAGGAKVSQRTRKRSTSTTKEVTTIGLGNTAVATPATKSELRSLPKLQH